VSRKGNVYKSFPGLCAAIRTHLDCEAVLDGEIGDPGCRRSATILMTCSGAVDAANRCSTLSIFSGLMARTSVHARCLSRAIAGMYQASSGAFDRAASRMPNATQRLLHTAEMRKLINVPRVSFESMMRKRARASLAKLRGSK
jgi:hypothetical protein